MFILLVMGLLFLWLNCRGKFMFLHCVALNRAEVTEPWNKYGPEANSLFWFRLGLGFLGMVLTLPLLGIIAVMILRMIYQGEPDVAGIMTAIGLGLALFLVGIVFVIIRKLMVDFVVPIMFLRQEKCWAAWKEFYRLFSARFWQFVLYLLFQIVLSMAIGMVVMTVLIATCCCCCLMLVPYISTVLLLPVLVFKRPTRSISWPNSARNMTCSRPGSGSAVAGFAAAARRAASDVKRRVVHWVGRGY